LLANRIREIRGRAGESNTPQLNRLADNLATCRYYRYIDKVSSRKQTVHSQINWKAVGRRLRELRGFDQTQQEFAALIGVSQSYLSSAERGENEIGPEILLRISRTHKKSIEWLLTGED
jgi:DNA-binding XRE family transcriptional regulator